MDWTHDLPVELCIEILKNLDIQDVLAISLTCHRWHDVVKHTEILWKYLVKSHCLKSYQYEELNRSQLNWQKMFKKTYGRHGTKNLWKSGHFSKVQSIQQLYPHKMYALSAQDWGDIFELELSR